MTGRIMSIVGLAAAIGLLFVVQSTTPQSVGPAGILSVFFLLYLMLVSVAMGLLLIGNRVMRSGGRLLSLRRPVEPLRQLHALYYASVIAFGPILLLGMSSVGRSGVYEWLLVIVFMAISVFYVRKRL